MCLGENRGFSYTNIVRNIFLILKSLKRSGRLLTLNNKREYRREGSRVCIRVKAYTILYVKCIVCKKNIINIKILNCILFKF